MKEFRKLANEKVKTQSLKFFKTGPGEYGEGDEFLGIRMPQVRVFAKKYIDIPSTNLDKLISSKYHEERMLGFLILLERYKKLQKSGPDQASATYKKLVKNKKYLNNWDLVDVICPGVIGAELLGQDKEVLYKWASSKNLWTRRIAIVSTFHFIRAGHYQTTLDLSKQLLMDKEDLIHKAVGWMLREVGKKERSLLDKFLKKHLDHMPRTMLRYAIEKYPEPTRKSILAGIWK